MDILFQNDFFSYQIKGRCKGLCHYDKGPTKDTCAQGGSPERHSGLWGPISLWSQAVRVASQGDQHRILGAGQQD